MKQSTLFKIGLALFTLLLIYWFWVFARKGVDIHQGEVYKVLYIHVPNAFSAFLSSFVLFMVSFHLLWKKNLRMMPYAKATAEIGFLFTILTLTTGSIWGKPTWGTWWTWDARLTTTFLLGVLYCAYLLLWSLTDDVYQRAKACSVVGILIFADIPIIYKSVSWWRTLHQPPSLMGSSGTTMSPSILNALLLGIALTVTFTLWLIWARSTNLKLEEKLQKEAIKDL
jgi:heme exporter protein C